ncbi:hypothetical protein [Paenibacillus sp. MER 99-2]|uniref:hypothetical protein n=1 Tax=Paenibacillus sp. MER 99-2 TaxID=2939572 RepID=UPI00203BB339|nr:hypothetical protein [Paenibacillus sp. MER 99-2]MCM3172333.1 hypothetical protein [Paenibacillus sp. MER 99-2]
MNVVLFILVNVLLCAGLIGSYMYLRRLKNLIGYHLGMNISMTVSTVSALSIGGLWGYQFPYYSTWVTIIATVIAMLIGMIFGALVDYQTIVTGVSGGIMAGLMSPMVVMHSHHPVPILIFCIFLFFFAILMLCTSVKV